MRTIICKNCGKSFEPAGSRTLFCCVECRTIWYNRKNFPDGSNYMECKICGHRARELFSHIMKVHKMKLLDYYIKFNCDLSSIQCKELRSVRSENSSRLAKEGRCGFQKGKANPSHSQDCKNGRHSPFSMNFSGYDGLTEQEKRERINNICKNANTTRLTNQAIPTMLGYYLKQGLTEEEARQEQHKRQQTFTLKKCIERYGEEQGKQVWQDRQIRWQNTLKNKSPEEIARINSLKASSCCFLHSYSKKSQKLFKEIESRIRNDFSSIYFATYHDGKIVDDGINHEYIIFLEDNIHRFFLDFYVADNNKVIEFDGTWWHSKPEKIEYDAYRENKLHQLGFTNILHINEADYDDNKDAVIERCIRFIYE